MSGETTAQEAEAPTRKGTPGGCEMRISRPDDYAAIVREIGNLEKDAMGLGAQRVQLEAALQEALRRDAARFEESEVRRLRRDFASVQEQQQLVADRVSALRTKLPNDEERRAAEAEAKVLLKSYEAAAKHFGKAWNGYVEALAAAEAAAREVSTARAEVRGLLVRLEDVVGRFDLDIAIPRAAEITGAKVAYLTGLMLSQVALGEPDDVVVRDLAAARRRLAS